MERHSVTHLLEQANCRFLVDRVVVHKKYLESLIGVPHGFESKLVVGRGKNSNA